jgi:hypothetical protein
MATKVQVYKADDGWGVKVVGDNETPEHTFGSKEEAEAEGRKMAEARGGELIVHDESGATEEKESP